MFEIFEAVKYVVIFNIRIGYLSLVSLKSIHVVLFSSTTGELHKHVINAVSPIWHIKFVIDCFWKHPKMTALLHL